MTTHSLDRARLERLYTAEKRIAALRLAVVASGTIIYPLFEPGIPPLAYGLLALGWIYSLAVYFSRPERRHRLMGRYATTIGDAMITMIWLYATGGADSPFFLAIYLAILTVAYRFNPRETLLLAAVYAASYLGLLAAVGQVAGRELDVTVRITYMLLAAMLGATVSHDMFAQMAANVATEARLAAEQERARLATERKALEARLLVSDRLASVGTLAAGVAHEVNNPLTYVASNLELIGERLNASDGAVAPELRRELDRMIAEARDGATRIRRIVRDLRTFARPEEERHGAVDVRRVIDSTLALAHNEIRHRAQLVRDLDDVPSVQGSEARIGQLLLNLLINAAHAIPEGDAPNNEIGVSTRAAPEGCVTIEVRDSGSGIPPEILPRIFDPFFTTKPLGVGTGLGLSISRAIATSLGGTIEVESEAGRGSRFRVVLPVSDGAPAPEPEPARAEAVSSHRGRVLVIDDERMVLRSIERTLRGEHDVAAVTSAREGLRRIERGEEFDVIVSDVMMPDMTGAELYAELVRTRPEQAERMLFLTGGAFTSGARDFLDEIPNPRLDKPFDVEELRSLVGNLVRQSAPVVIGPLGPVRRARGST
jgi:signal transduction histidine kinase/ActR/RegA family two-component response regulator